jgi:hypothetical protein
LGSAFWHGDGALEKLVWRVKLVAETGGEAAREIEVARIERDPYAQPETLGLSIEDGKRIAAGIQREMVREQALVMGEHFRCCGHCGLTLPARATGA